MLNLDFLAFIAVIVALTVVLALAWRALKGRAYTPWWACVRVAALFFVALVIVAAGSYVLMNARTFQVAGKLVSHADTSRKVVALTFDDGPAGEDVDEILGGLDRYHAKGTFFVIGEVGQREPAALRTLAAAGEEIGNHSYTHARLVGVSVARAADEVERTDAVIRASGYDGPVLFRPPYCKKLVSLPYYLWRHARTTVTWSLEPDSGEAAAGDPKAIVRAVLAEVKPGSIILLHPWGESRAATREALPLILEALAARGYSFVTVSQLPAK